MESITDMFLEGSPRIFTNLNRVDLVERAANSVVWKEVLRRALQLIHVLLVPDLARCALLIPFARCFSVVCPLSSMRNEYILGLSPTNSVIGLPFASSLNLPITFLLDSSKNGLAMSKGEKST